MLDKLDDSSLTFLLQYFTGCFFRLHKAIASREKKEKELAQAQAQGGRGGRGGPRGGGPGWGGRGGGGRGGGGRGGGSSGPRFMGYKQEKQLWESLIEYLKENDNLPVSTNKVSHLVFLKYKRPLII